MSRAPPVIPGYKLVNEGRYTKRCKCTASVMMARMDEIGRPWLAFEPEPIDGDIRHYRMHWCPVTLQESPLAQIASRQRKLL